MDEGLKKRILHLFSVEKLSFRQIGIQLGICRNAVSGIVRNFGIKEKHKKESKLDSYRALIGQWYKEYPLLKAKQIYERLRSYGFNGSYPLVVAYTKGIRDPKHNFYHALEFLPGQEAQVDWIEVTDLPFGKVYGFIFVLSYSRYAWGVFYPRNSYEFFLDGHIQCFRKIGGVPHSCRYDNLKSVVISRDPHIQYNSQFLDFSMFYGFSIYLCNPYSAHEKGRVERLGRDIRGFLYGRTFKDIIDLNTQFHEWLDNRSNTIHRVTQKKSVDLLKLEKLLSIPSAEYSAGKIIQATASKTGFVELDTNKYSVPNTCSSMSAELIAYPDKIVVMINGNRVAVHKRSFLRNQVIENPLHREKLLDITPKYKQERILQLMKKVDPSIELFLNKVEESGEDQIEYAYQLFKLLKLFPRITIISCVREACSVNAFKIKTVFSLLKLPHEKENNPVYPKDTNLLDIKYQERKLEEYDRFT